MGDQSNYLSDIPASTLVDFLVTAQQPEQLDELLDWFLFTYSPEKEWARFHQNSEAMKDPRFLDLIVRTVVREYQPDIFLETVNLLASVDNYELPIIQVGLIPSVLAAMGKDEDNPRSQQLGCRILACLAFNGNIRNFFASCGATKKVVNALETHQTNQFVVLDVYKALTNIAFRSNMNKELLIKENIMELILDITENFKQDPRIVNEGLMTMRSIISNRILSQHQQHIVAREVLLKMFEYKDIAEIQVNSLWIMILLFTGSVNMKKHAVTQLGALLHIFRAIENFPDNPYIQLPGCILLALIAKISVHRYKIADSGIKGVRVLTTAINKWITDVEIIRAALKALFRLSFSKDIREDIGQTSAVLDTVLIMGRYKTVSYPVVRSCCIFLVQLSKCPNNALYLREDPVKSSLLLALDDIIFQYSDKEVFREIAENLRGIVLDRQVKLKISKNKKQLSNFKSGDEEPVSNSATSTPTPISTSTTTPTPTPTPTPKEPENNSTVHSAASKQDAQQQDAPGLERDRRRMEREARRQKAIEDLDKTPKVPVKETLQRNVTPVTITPKIPEPEPQPTPPPAQKTTPPAATESALDELQRRRKEREDRRKNMYENEGKAVLEPEPAPVDESELRKREREERRKKLGLASPNNSSALAPTPTSPNSSSSPTAVSPSRKRAIVDSAELISVQSDAVHEDPPSAQATAEISNPPPSTVVLSPEDELLKRRKEREAKRAAAAVSTNIDDETARKRKEREERLRKLTEGAGPVSAPPTDSTPSNLTATPRPQPDTTVSSPPPIAVPHEEDEKANVVNNTPRPDPVPSENSEDEITKRRKEREQRLKKFEPKNTEEDEAAKRKKEREERLKEIAERTNPTKKPEPSSTVTPPSQPIESSTTLTETTTSPPVEEDEATKRRREREERRIEMKRIEEERQKKLEDEKSQVSSTATTPPPEEDEATKRKREREERLKKLEEERNKRKEEENNKLSTSTTPPEEDEATKRRREREERLKKLEEERNKKNEENNKASASPPEEDEATKRKREREERLKKFEEERNKRKEEERIRNEAASTSSPVEEDEATKRRREREERLKKLEEERNRRNEASVSSPASEEDETTKRRREREERLKKLEEERNALRQERAPRISSPSTEDDDATKRRKEREERIAARNSGASEEALSSPLRNRERLNTPVVPPSVEEDEYAKRRREREERRNRTETSSTEDDEIARRRKEREERNRSTASTSLADSQEDDMAKRRREREERLKKLEEERNADEARRTEEREKKRQAREAERLKEEEEENRRIEDARKRREDRRKMTDTPAEDTSSYRPRKMSSEGAKLGSPKGTTDSYTPTRSLRDSQEGNSSRATRTTSSTDYRSTSTSTSSTEYRSRRPY